MKHNNLEIQQISVYIEQNINILVLNKINFIKSFIIKLKQNKCIKVLKLKILINHILLYLMHYHLGKINYVYLMDLKRMNLKI